ncbi:MAG: phosphocarrier protein HPr [Gammaproteobacteria bacterium]|nr:phosphocarrier protein HPr [Gammaproteobacteria bacterium]MBJ54117.1 phosphocarrier protein HPr [Gammaproteobacteria bacterium]HBN14720.1 HPr family phosphocarrier protein [Pseudohongiella sp.]|tara:strand:- start:1934 stop:2200 length:267 start_codon:yes stop_codon:yes gene_type:complete
MIESTITICNKAGLHARAASKLVGVVNKYQSKVHIGNEKLVDAHSILSLMMLAAGKGTTLRIVVDGDDESAALEDIVALVNNRFDEGE